MVFSELEWFNNVANISDEILQIIGLTEGTLNY